MLGRLRGLCLYPCAILAALNAVFLGYFASTPIPEGTAFATLIPLFGGGYLPATLVGDDWWETRSPVPTVPAELRPSERPAGEIMLPLLGGDRMPALGLGLCCRPAVYDTHSVSRSVLWYLLQGGRHVDTAQLYLNHEGVGKGMAEAIARGVPRSEIFLVTKIPPRFFAGDQIDSLIPAFLAELQVDYLDLVLLHHPQGLPGGLFGFCQNGTAPECRTNAWARLSKWRERGVIRNIGVSNHNERQMDELRALKLAPVSVNQIQFNPWAPDRIRKVAEYCERHEIVLTAWGPFQGTMMQHASMFTVQTLKEIAEAHDRSVPQVLLRWTLQRGYSAIPGTGNPKHMADNLGVHAFKLSDEEMKRVDTVRDDPGAKRFVAFGFEYNDS